MDLDPPRVCAGSSDSGPTPTCSVPTEPTAATARPSSARRRTVCSDAPQERRVRAWQQGPCAHQERLQLAFTALLLELICGFSPTSACAPPTGLWSRAGRSPSGALGRQGQHVGRQAAFVPLLFALQQCCFTLWLCGLPL